MSQISNAGDAGDVSSQATERPDTEEFARKVQELQLRCAGCGTSDTYDVGTIFWEMGEKGAGPRFTFTKYFRCRRCDHPGPWEPANDMSLMGRILHTTVGKGEDEGIMRGSCILFDGSVYQTPAMAEDYLLELLRKEPDRSFLHTRLGNLLRASGERVRSVECARARSGRHRGAPPPPHLRH